MKSCAICTTQIPATGKPRIRPLGKGDAMVEICPTCDDEPAYEKQGRFQGYEGPGSFSGLEPHIDAFMTKVGIPAINYREGNSVPAHDKRPGYKVGRIGKRDTNKRRRLTMQQAKKLAVKKWGKGAIKLAITPTYYVFQYPEPKPPSLDAALKPLSKFQRK